MHLKKYFFIYILIILASLSVGASFYRFVILNDYIVEYEGECDPRFNSCFIGCSDESCTNTYYYSKIKREATELLSKCGNNILECESAESCQEDSGSSCITNYCEPSETETECSDLQREPTQSTEEIEIINEI